jgi:hypothetical protein
MLIAASVATRKSNELNPSFVDQGSPGLFRKNTRLFSELGGAWLLYGFQLNAELCRRLFLVVDFRCKTVAGRIGAGAESALRLPKASRTPPGAASSARDGSESAGRVYLDLCLLGISFAMP